MRKSFFILVVGMVGLTMIMGACAKKAKPGEEAGMKEERIASSPEEGQGMQEPGMGESDVEAGGMPGEAAPVAGLTSILFDFDQFNIREDQRPVIEANAKWMKSNPGVSVTIEGHADERGTNEYNLALGERRAQATKRYLLTLGIEQSRLSTVSYGEERPLCMEKDESCYLKNRRAQFGSRK